MSAADILAATREAQLSRLIDELAADTLVSADQLAGLRSELASASPCADHEFNALEWLARKRLRAHDQAPIDERWLSLWWAQRSGLELIHLHPSRVDLTLTARYLRRQYCLLHRVLVINHSSDRVQLAYAQPPDAVQLELLRRVFARELDLAAIHAYQWRNYFRSSFSIQRSLSALSSAIYASKKSAFQPEEATLSAMSESDQQVIQLVDWLFEYVAARLISDVHIEAQARDALIRVRVDGQLQELISLPLPLAQRMSNRMKVLAGLELSYKRIPQDGRFTLQSSGGELLQVRISAVASSFGEKIALRFFHEQLLFEQIATLGMPARQLQSWQRLINTSSGLILITGPTGSGKTTTLYASLLELANRALNIATIEDPVELLVDKFTQIQINPELDYAGAIKSLLRQDPDVIMVGEVRDQATAQAVLQAAQTGHLVFATVHSSDSLGAIVRLLDLEVPWYLLQESLLGVLTQRLLPLLCPSCRQGYAPAEAEQWAQQLGGAAEAGWRHASGCERCRMLGIQGRQPIFELLNFGSALQQIERYQPELLLRHGCGASLRAAAEQLAAAGTVSPETVLSLTPAERERWYSGHPERSLP